MLRKEKNFQIVVYEAHLLGDIRKCLKLLDNSGKYFYIKHNKECSVPHYHIYYVSNDPISFYDFASMFLVNVANQAEIDIARMGKYPFITYMLQNGKYRLRDIKGTMSLA